MKKSLLSLIALGVFTLSAIGQNNALDVFPRAAAVMSGNISKPQPNVVPLAPGEYEKCGQKSHSDALAAVNARYREGRISADNEIRRIVEEFESGNRAAPPVYTIPVVFHVIHKGEAVGSGTNISDAQIQSAIAALNRDYRRTSANGGIAQGAGPDTEIQFCLASLNPSGQPTTGINRVNGTSVSGYSSSGITSSNESNVKALSRWDNRYYLNIWVVSEIDGNGADLSNPANWQGGTLGYAYLPTNPVTWNSDLDGIVAVNLCVGNDPNQSLGYRLWPWGGLTNRTLTHEVGHFLNLNHTFEGESCSESNCNTQGDQVCDTPPTQSGSSCNDPSCTNTIVENYMDYTEESCQDMFTAGQTTRMRAALTGPRSALVATSNCTVSSNNYDAGISAIVTPSGSLCATSFSPIVTLTNSGSTTLTSVQIQYFVDANSPSSYSWTGSLSSGSSTNVTLPSVTTTTGNHTFTARTVSTSLNGSNTDQATSNDQSSSSFSVSGSGNTVTLTLDLDCFGDEITWEIVDGSNNVMGSGGPYVNNVNGEQVVETFCLAQGCYDFNIFDTYGDGLYGSQYQSCTINGDYEIRDASNNILVQMTATDGDFGSGTSHNFCVGGGGSGGTTCEDLVYFDGSGFFVNPTDLPNFDILVSDVDQQAVATPLANAGYTSDWMAFYEVIAPGDTNFFIRATSWFANNTVAANNWITFGPVTMTDQGGSISWNHRMPDIAYRDGYRVLVNTTGGAVANFTGATVLYSVASNDPSTDGDTVWTAQSVQLPAGTYAGQTLYFAFNHNALDMFFLDLDEIVVEGCSSTPVSVVENAEFKMNVFPNPSSENFTFQYTGADNERLDFVLTNAVGQQVWSYTARNTDSGMQTIRTSDLSSGIYTLLVTGDKLRVSEKLILTK
jgi:hypothetical protein